MPLDISTFWLIFLASAAPVAGVVGFGIQLRTVKKIRLENEKLILEIQSLRKKHEESERRIVAATTDEVIKYNDILFSRRGDGVNPGPGDENSPHAPSFIPGFILALLAIAFFSYLIFDIYRLVMWLWSRF